MICISALGQDIHFSQYYAAPLELNPANTGLIRGAFRIGVNSKNQWSSVTKPYQTIAAYFDMPVIKRKYRKDALGAGLLVNADIAGDSKFSTINAGLSISYIKSISYLNNNFLSIGIMPMFVQRSIDFSELNFDNQFNGNYFDPNINPNEPTGKKSFIYFDMSAGIHWHYIPNDKTAYSAGFSVAHPTRPKMTFLNNNEIRLDIKYITYGDAQVTIAPDIDLLPSLMLVSQGPFFELVSGVMLKYSRGEYYIERKSLNFGLYARYADAIIVVAGFELKNINFGVSYDLNLSKLRVASKVRGGLEFSISYIFDKNKYKRNKQIPCPIF
jgi:type IX secretion system PorP/SprF family membrane protein